MSSTPKDDGHQFPANQLPALRQLAMPKDTNPSGHIFGGWIMSQMDIAGSIKAVEVCGQRVATVAVTSMEFHRPVFVGDLVSCFCELKRVGTTSITVAVEVYAQRGGTAGKVTSLKVTEAVIVYVAMDAEGRPQPITPSC